MQLVLIAAVSAIALGALVAMFLMRPREDDWPPPIADPYDELYSELRGQVVARPLGEPHAGEGRKQLRDPGALDATEPDTDAAELVPARPAAWHDRNRGEADLP